MSIMSRLKSVGKFVTDADKMGKLGEKVGDNIGKTIVGTAKIGVGTADLGLRATERVASPILGMASKAVKFGEEGPKITGIGAAMVGASVAYRGVSDAAYQAEDRNQGIVTGSTNMTPQPQFGPDYANTGGLVFNLHNNSKSY